jgi:hypothetical protein
MIVFTAARLRHQVCSASMALADVRGLADDAPIKRGNPTATFPQTWLGNSRNQLATPG